LGFRNEMPQSLNFLIPQFPVWEFPALSPTSSAPEPGPGAGPVLPAAEALSQVLPELSEQASA